jgi:hypothetical protein
MVGLPVYREGERPADLLTRKEVAGLVGVSENTLSAWTAKGWIRPVGALQVVRTTGGTTAGLYRRADALAARSRPRGPRFKPGRATKPGAPPLAPAPTTTRPGSPERVAVYEERVRQGFAALHPKDTRIVIPTYLRGAAA